MNFTRGYMKCALWASTDENGVPLDASGADFAPETLEAMRADCKRFQRDNAVDIGIALPYYNAIDARGRAGHDFWLTHNGHGAGFWDGDLPKELGDRLTKAAEAFGTCDLYVGDDGRVLKRK